MFARRQALLDPHRPARVLDMARPPGSAPGDRNDEPGATAAGNLARIATEDRIAVGRGELVGLGGENNVNGFDVGEETLDRGSLGRAQILIDHEKDAIGRRGAGRKFGKPPLVTLDGAGVDQRTISLVCGGLALVASTRTLMSAVLPLNAGPSRRACRVPAAAAAQRDGRLDGLRQRGRVAGAAHRQAVRVLPLLGNCLGAAADDLGRERDFRL